VKKLTSAFSGFSSIRVVQAICLVLLFLNLLALLYGSTFLRPAADDYCLGALVAEHGILGGIYHWWMTHSSSVFTLFLLNLFVGAPLAYLTPSLGSALPFVCSILAVGFLVYALYPERPKERFGKLIFVALAGFFWWVFLWSRNALGLNLNDFSLMAEGLTHWQNLNGAYVATFFALLAAYAWLARQTERTGPQLKAAAIFLGLVAGQAGSSVALGFFLFGLIALVCLFYQRQASSSLNIKTDLMLWIIFCAALVVAFVICHTLSPGHAARQKILNPDLTISLRRLFALGLFTCKGLIRFFLHIYRSYPALLLILAAASFSAVFTGSFPKADKLYPRLALTSGSFFLLSLVMAGATQVGDFLIYQAYWHLIPATLSAYLAVVFGGAALGGHISSRHGYKNVFAPICLIIMGFYTWTNINALGDILEREAMWRVGPAPTRSVTDIDGDWQRACFDRLNKYRKAPIIRERNEGDN